MKANNLKSDIPEPMIEEIFETIVKNDGLKIERIISDGHSSPEDFWYDQAANEFVLIVEGNALLRFENGEAVEMKEGDYLIIPAHKKHRVEKTSPEGKTVWLAIHY